jgi:hypothetical protein
LADHRWSVHEGGCRLSLGDEATLVTMPPPAEVRALDVRWLE